MVKETESILELKNMVKKIIQLKREIKDENKHYRLIKDNLNESVGRVFLKIGNKFTLECNHEGKIVWISPDEESFCVRGVNRSCRVCGKKSSGGWVPFVYLISTDEVAEND